MIYLSWATFFEGNTDKLYFDVLIPRIMEAMVASHGTQHSVIPTSSAVSFARGSVEKVAAEVCRARDSFFIFFVHADTGGRRQEEGISARSCAYCTAIEALCSWPLPRCVVIAPRKETEAWLLADPIAVTSSLGYTGSPTSLGLPSDARSAERLPNPKEILAMAVKQVRRRRPPADVKFLFPAIAQRQSLEELRKGKSYVAFEARVRTALADMGCVTKG